MEGMSKTTEDLRISSKPGHVEYNRLAGNGLTAIWMATWTDRQTDKTVGKVTRNPLEVSFKNAFRMTQMQKNFGVPRNKWWTGVPRLLAL